MLAAVSSATACRASSSTCLFVLHHVESSDQARVLHSIHRRLLPGSHFVFSEHAAIGADPEGWLARSVTFSQGTGIESSEAAERAAMMNHRLHLHTLSETEAMLRDAGFHDLDIFYAAFSLRGWVATA